MALSNKAFEPSAVSMNNPILEAFMNNEEWGPQLTPLESEMAKLESDQLVINSVYEESLVDEIGSVFHAMKTSRSATEQGVASENDVVREAAYYIITQYFPNNVPLYSLLEHAANHEANCGNRGMAMHGLWRNRHCADSQARDRICSSLVRVIKNVDEPDTVRAEAYKTLIYFCDASNQVAPPPSAGEFPQNVDWSFLSSVVGHR